MIQPPPSSTLFPYTTLFRSRPPRRPQALYRPAPGSTPYPHQRPRRPTEGARAGRYRSPPRSEEHTSELQSRVDLVCRLLLEKKKLILWYFLLTAAISAFLLA